MQRGVTRQYNRQVAQTIGIQWSMIFSKSIPLKHVVNIKSRTKKGKFKKVTYHLFLLCQGATQIKSLNLSLSTTWHKTKKPFNLYKSFNHLENSWPTNKTLFFCHLKNLKPPALRPKTARHRHQVGRRALDGKVRRRTLAALMEMPCPAMSRGLRPIFWYMEYQNEQ